MHLAMLILQVLVALGLLNVWLLRVNQPTAYRGGNAKTMKQEFEAYGMPVWSMYVVGGLKIVIAICFLAGLRFPGLVMPAAVVLAALMLGAILMHLKIHDAAKKSIPAGALLLISLFVCFVSYSATRFQV